MTPSASSTKSGGRPRFGLAAYLVALVLAVLLPALGLGAAAAWQAAQGYRAAFADRLHDTARALATALDAEFGAHFGALVALSAAHDLAEGGGDLAAFYDRARLVAEAFGTRVSVLGPPPDFRFLLNTDVPFGGPLPEAPVVRNPRSATARAFETGRPAVGDLLTSGVTGRFSVGMYVPVVRDGRPVLVVGMVVEPERLARLLRAQGLTEGAFAVFADAAGAVVARSSEHEAFVGRPVPTWYTEGFAGRERGIVRGRAIDGREMIFAFDRPGLAPGWTVVVAVPLAAYEAGWRRPMLGLLVGGVLALAAGTALAFWLARRLLRPVAALARHAEAVAAAGGGAAMPAPPPAPVAEFEALRRSLGRAEAALREGEERLRILFEAVPVGVLVVDPETLGFVAVNDRACALLGYTREELSRLRLPDIDAVMTEDAIRAQAQDRAAQSRPTEFETQHRTKSGAVRDVLVRAANLQLGGRVLRYSAWIDITKRKRAEEQQALLARELDHRAKNVLAVVQSVAQLTRAERPRDLARALQERIMALARAHSLLAGSGWTGADLRALAEAELAAFAGRLDLDGPPVWVTAEAVQPLAMVLHELVSNAAQHGALSTPEGRVSVAWTKVDDGFRLRWAEHGGPPIAGPPDRRGFGSRLLDATVRRQLGGSIDFDWDPTGLICTIAVPTARLRGAVVR